MRLLVTGGAGFIGSNFVHYVLREHPDWEVVNLDNLTYAGNLDNLKDIESNDQYRFVKGDITDREAVDSLFREGFDTVVNFAAESHVDRSIMDSSPFLKTNVEGTQVMLEAAKAYGISLFVQVSTDEVYGSAEDGVSFDETALLAPSSPYSASKAAADLMCGAYWKTHNLPVVITRCSNNYGPFQFPEKLIPLVISNALEGKEIPVYGDGLNVRDWIYVEDHCRALDTVMQKGKPGGIYNIAADNERTNLQIVEAILHAVGKPRSLMTFVKDRPGHDRRYALDIEKIKHQLGWKPATAFEEGIRKTIEWYTQNETWWRRIKSGEYAKYYERLYSQR
ncbi:MAG: dTDP-glucose 4,6-dehydratase [Chloroflexota bacterium]